MERLSTSISQNCETLIRRRALLKHNAVTRGWYRKALPGFGGKYIRLKAARYKLRLLMLFNPRLCFQQLAVLVFKRAVSARAFTAIQGCVCLRQQRQLACGNDLSASELAHKYTQPEDYFVWAREFMDVQE